MYLINTKTLKLEEFPDSRGLSYAILSHRWEKEEITFQDMQTNNDIAQKAGYNKVKRCCLLAADNGLPYAWVDTCCIDKRSSAELQEAINSMFGWYRDAKVCYIYLSDVEGRDFLAIKSSQWFCRGWTLQELIAPRSARFYTAKWNFIGTKEENPELFSYITGIPQDILDGRVRNLSSYTIAERMSWANGRITTRIEDRAYSLLGIFDVNMPMLYGEGGNAFRRLQEEILRKTRDQSILAWSSPEAVEGDVFARSPDDFPVNPSGGRCRYRVAFGNRGAHSVTNEGFNLELSLMPWWSGVYMAVLNHHDPCIAFTAEGTFLQRQCIFLRRLDHENRFLRVADANHGYMFEGSLDLGRWTAVGLNTTRYIARPTRSVRCTIMQGSLPWEELYPKAEVMPDQIHVHGSAHIHGLATAVESQVCTLQPGHVGPFISFRPSCDLLSKVMIGLDFDFQLVIVIHMNTEECPVSSVHDPLQRFDEITCLEDEGWLTIKFYTNLRANKLCKVNQHMLVWPFKLESMDFRRVKQPKTLICYANLMLIDDRTLLRMEFRLWRKHEWEPWNIRFFKYYCFISEKDSKEHLPNYSYECYPETLPPEIAIDEFTKTV